MFFSVLFHIYGVLIALVSLFFAAVALVVCYPFDRGRKVVHFINVNFSKLHLSLFPFWRWIDEGFENIERDKSYVIVVNHTEMMDIPIAYRLPLYFKWVSKREVFKLPIFGQYLMLRGDIAIERGNGAEALAQVVEKGKRVIGLGQSVAIFPEGTRSRDGVIGRFKAGAFNLAREADVEILPVVIDGADRLLDMKSGRYGWRSKITIRVLPAVKSDWTDNAGCKDFMDSVRESMVDALAEIRDQQQEVSNKRSATRD